MISILLDLSKRAFNGLDFSHSLSGEGESNCCSIESELSRDVNHLVLCPEHRHLGNDRRDSNEINILSKCSLEPMKLSRCISFNRTNNAIPIHHLGTSVLCFLFLRIANIQLGDKGMAFAGWCVQSPNKQISAREARHRVAGVLNMRGRWMGEDFSAFCEFDFFELGG